MGIKAMIFFQGPELLLSMDFLSFRTAFLYFKLNLYMSYRSTTSLKMGLVLPYT